MNPASFLPNAPGNLVRSPEGFWAFVPAKMPRRLDLDERTVYLLSVADLALGQISGIGRLLPNPHLLIRPFLHREAVLSSRIEGTLTRVDQLLLFEADPGVERVATDVREVYNYVLAMEHGLELIKDKPVSLEVIRELHRILLQGVRGEERNPGEFRMRQNAVGRPGQPFEEARFLPPPVIHLQDCLDDLQNFLISPPPMPLLVQCAIAHYQFEAIHPFMDGNGRIGRLLIALTLCDRGRLQAPLLYLSGFLEERRNEYVDKLLRVSQEGAWQEWIRFFVKGIHQEAGLAIDRSARLVRLREEMRSQLQVARRSALQLRLVDELFASPYISANITSDRLKVTHRTAVKVINKLVDAGILRQLVPKQRNRIYYAPAIVDLISA